jgi:hypothetical protein
MSRSNYSDDCDPAALNRWRGAVRRASTGKRGQAFLAEALTALDAMPEKRLTAGELDGDLGCCVLGAVSRQRGIDVLPIDPEDYDAVAFTFGIAPALAREIVYINDEAHWGDETDEQRWSRVRRWVASQIGAEETR